VLLTNRSSTVNNSGQSGVHRWWRAAKQYQ
jgi:hypothetical protein